MADSEQPKLHGWRFVLFNLCLGLSHVLVIFNAGAYIAMLPRVAAGLGIPPSFATWTQTDYMVGLALAFPVGGWLSRRLGEYRPFVAAFFVFALASVICATMTSFYAYLAGRIVLGFAGGLTLPLGQSLLIKEYPEQKKSIGIGVWSVFTLTPFTFAQPIGGWIADTLGWRWLFWLNIPTALTIGGVVGALLYRRGITRIRHRFDGVGFVLIALALFGTQTVLNQGNDWDWTNSLYIGGLIIVVVATLIYWVIWECSHRRPFLDIRLFTHRNFTIGVIILFLGFLMFQGLLSMLIVQLQLALGYSSLLAGLVFLPMAILAKPVAGVFHEVVKYIDARWWVSLNCLGFAAIYFWLSHFDGHDAFAQLFWPKVLEGACLGSFFVPVTALILHGLAPEQTWRAVELASLLRIAAGAMGISLQGIVIYRRAPVHITRFAESHTLFDGRLEQTLDTLVSAGFNESTAIARLAKLAGRDAVIHAMNDAFWLASCLFVGLSILVWFANPTKLSAKRTLKQLQRRETQEMLVEAP
ncbi:DHA2 family efflux MFS transporter permease subunit [Methylomonas methanica]|uniref:Drug resistance transporter, EmrB/QacA subfamily n=1 Tax=Methylomonas methanica (strain DSM 25384 / MC09) TaxID=857087 RepID=F9ZWP6_METMM|nr:DHA2 family efflux MFS transporter permease subunit [Methylomonas methanica]AEG00893.1 drug resistance transporter, EmrB/QacA subfamily [Methylomonas methanica MC09]